MIVLDTDHISALQHRRSSSGDRLRERLVSSFSEGVAVSAITLEEQSRGWLAQIHKQGDALEQVPFYDRLVSLFSFFADWDVLPFDVSAAVEFQRLKTLRPRLGTMDLKIAAIAIVHQATLLSRNLSDFEQIPGLTVDDWLADE